MTDKYGFSGTSKRPAMDLTSIPKGPIEVDSTREGQALQRAADLGFVERGGSATAVSSRRRRKAKEPTKSIYVRGPQSIIDRFIAFADEHEFSSYAAAIESLLDTVQLTGHNPAVD